MGRVRRKENHINQQGVIEELQAKVRRAEDWLAEARRNGDQGGIVTWKAQIAKVQNELKEAQEQ